MTSTDPTAPWHRRVVPVTGVALVAMALAALLVPGVRDQLALSATHQPEPYVELYFARTAHGYDRPCTSTEGKVDVGFAVHSHLPDTQGLRYVVKVGERRSTGSVSLRPGEVVETTALLPHPDGRYDVTVRLLGTDQSLAAHCGGARR